MFRYLYQLTQQIDSCFNLSEIQELCMALIVDYEHLSGETRPDKIRSLLLYMVRHKRLEELLPLLAEMRPKHQWSAVPSNMPMTTADVVGYFHRGTEIPFPNFTVSIDNFIQHYLGRPGNPVPFGGRDEHLQKLNEWFVAVDSPQRLLLVAPAGRGKSALLVRWIKQLVTTEDLDVVFMPISLRFNSNREDSTFVLLATQLANFYSKPIPTDYLNMTPHLWRGLVAEYLREPLPDNRRLLLILDGLDEAAWDVAADILPMTLPDTVRVVVSARYLGGEAQSPAPWLRRLNWDRFPEMAVTLELTQLTPIGVADVLKTAFPLDELGQDADIVTELYRLSEGDPLLMELYIKDLWQQGDMVSQLQPKDLPSIKPGYQGYFDRWMHEQKQLWGKDWLSQEPIVWKLLNLMSLAYGRLMVEDIQELLADSFLVESFLIQEAIALLARFVIGDGQNEGYTFSHPKLADYFAGRLTKHDKKNWQRRYLDWGKQSLQGVAQNEMEPGNVSTYLMQYYGRHLETAQASIESLLSLVSWAWMQVWYEQTKNYSGFLLDVERLEIRVRAENETAVSQRQAIQYLGLEILCALCRSSIISLAENISTPLLKQLVQEGIWNESRAMAFVQQKQAASRVEALGAIRPYCTDRAWVAVTEVTIKEVGQIRKAQRRAEILIDLFPYLSAKLRAQILDTILNRDLYNIHHTEARVRVLDGLAPYLPEALRQQVFNDFLAKIPQIKIAKSRAKARAVLAPHFPEELQTQIREDALADIRQIEDADDRSIVLALLAENLPEEVFDAALQFVDIKSRAKVLATLAPYLPDLVLVEVRFIKEEKFRASILTALAEHLPEAVLGQSLQIEDERIRASILAALAEHLPEAVLTEVEQIEDDRARVKILLALAEHLPEAVLTEVEQIEDVQDRIDILTNVTPHLSPEKRDRTLRLVLGYSRRIKPAGANARAKILEAMAAYIPEVVLNDICQNKDTQARDDVLQALARYLPQPQHVLTYLPHINDLQHRADILRTLGKRLPAVVWTEAQQIGDVKVRAQVLTSIAEYLPDKVLDEARKIQDVSAQSQVLIALAEKLPEKVLEEARKIQDVRAQSQVLIALAEKLPEKILGEAREIQDVGTRSKILAALVKYLPEVVLIEARQIRPIGALTTVFSAVACYAPDDVLDNLHQIIEEASLVKILVALAPCRSEIVLAYIQKINNKKRRFELLMELAPYQPQAVLEQIEQIEDIPFRIKVFTALAPHLSGEARQQTLKKTFDYSASQLLDEGVRLDVLKKLSPHLSEDVLIYACKAKKVRERIDLLTTLSSPNILGALTPPDLYKLWQAALPDLSQRPRPDLLLDIAAMMPVIHKLGGDKAMHDIYNAMGKVTAWWP